MPVQTQELRSRTVVFRLTETEYAALKRACSREHRSISEFARLELLLAIHAEREDDSADSSARNLREELSRMQAKLEELKEILLCKTDNRAISAGNGAPRVSA